MPSRPETIIRGTGTVGDLERDQDAGMVDALIYESHAAAALTDTELELILIRSRTVNALRGITGALIKSGGRIVQYLEGDAATIDRVFDHIAASRLHTDVRLLARVSGVARQFDVWHMGFHDFQRDHRRGTTTDEWIDALPALRNADPGNAALTELVRAWDEFSQGAGPR